MSDLEQSGSNEIISSLTRNAGGTPAMMCRSDALYSCAVARRLSRGVEVICSKHHLVSVLHTS